MPRARRAGHRRPTETDQAVPTWGPEPIGASQVDALLAVQGALMSGGGGQVAGWGLDGAQETTDAHVYAPPQQFIGTSGMVSGVPLIDYPATGLPESFAPPSLVGMSPDFPLT